jgi:hypothetical protein
MYKASIPLSSSASKLQSWCIALLLVRTNAGSRSAKELHVYPASRGNVLRYIGKDVQGAVELLYEHAKNVLKVMTTKRDGRNATSPT